MWLLGMLTAAFAADWGDTIDDVVGSVLVLRWEQPRAFDGESRSAPQASGFVVDAEKGIVLTNRHVVGTGPQIAHALFPNQEEVRLTPLYSDPIHDFGFYRYDPSTVRLNSPRSLELKPEGAQVGTEIRLIGNDAGEQISILDGTLSRLDRPAPWWDMNTFYVQAASDSSGGSSGSPVFGIEGDVVALNAGGRRRESTSYYLRLERVKVALEALREGRIPSRGTVMTQFLYAPYDELSRLGLTEEAEDAARAAWDGTGLLVVGRVGRGGPAVGQLQPGDILLQADGQAVFDFATLEGIWDANVGRTVQVRVERGGKTIDVELDVRDLHAETPTSFLMFGESVVHDVGYWATIRNERPPTGVIVADTGRLFNAAGIPRDAILESINGTTIDSLDTLQEVLTSMAIGEVRSVVYTKLSDPHTRVGARLRMVDNLVPNQRCSREGTDWTCEDVPHPIVRAEPTPVQHKPVTVTHKKAAPLAQRLVSVFSESAFPLNSSTSAFWRSAGILVDAEKGLILTDRYAVPNEAARVTVRAGDNARIPATIVSLDPLYNTAIVQVDPKLLQVGDLDPIAWSDEPLEPGRTYWAAVLDADGQVYSQERSFSRWDEMSLTKTAMPKFRADNLTTFEFGKLDRSALGGAVVDKKGRIVGLYQRFRNEKKANQPSPYVKAIETGPARAMLDGDLPRYSGIDLQRRSLAFAREAGMSAEQAERIRTHRPEDPIVMEVWRVDAAIDTDVRVGDFIVGIDDQTVASFRDFYGALSERNTVQVVRDGKELGTSLVSVDLSEEGPKRVIRWAGAWIQEEHPEVSRESGTPKDGVYISWFYGGSPAQRYGLGYGRRIVAVDGQPVDDLDAFLAAVEGKAAGESVRLTQQFLDGRERALTLRVDPVWWPTLELERVEGRWVRR